MSNHSAKSTASVSTQAMLSGPIVPIMMRLAVPTMIVMAIQTLGGVLETYFVSRLGTNALAGVSLVFPVLMLMQMMSGGGFGAGVTSAIARSLGAGHKADADALVMHAIAIGLGLGLIFTVAELTCGAALYSALGANGETLSAALAYSHVIFAGSALIWIVNLLAAALRGSGNVGLPALVSVASLVVMVPLSFLFIFGWGPVPALGVAGAGTAFIAFYVLAAIALIAYLRSGRGNVTLRFNAGQLKWRLFKDVLGVGSLSAIGAIQPNLTVVVVIGAVGLFGANAIAGYGIASRLEYTILPLVFGLGTAIITLVGTNVGAGNIERANRIAWISAFIVGAALELVGLVVAFFPHLWIGIFSNDPAVLEAGSVYLRTVGPIYGIYGIGMLLYFAGQGAGRVFWHVASGTIRLLITTVVGWLAVTRFGGDLTALFVVMAVGFIAFGIVNILAKWLGSWGPSLALPSEPQVGVARAAALSLVADDRQ